MTKKATNSPAKKKAIASGKGTYTVEKAHDTDARLTVVEKHGLTAFITLKECEDTLAQYNRDQKELVGQKIIEDAKAQNIQHHNPWLNDLSEQQLHAAYMYFEAMAKSKTCDVKIQDYKMAINAYELEKRELCDFLGYVPTDLAAQKTVADSEPAPEPAKAEPKDDAEKVSA